MRRTRLAFPGLIAFMLLISGCGFMHEHFGRNEKAYQKSVQEPPLEVPPDLDSPTTGGALTIPPAASGSAETGAATAPAGASSPVASPSAEPSSTPTAPTSTPPPISSTPGVVLSGDGLIVNDSADSAYARVGLALKRGGEAKVVASNDSERSYSVETTGQTTTEAGWFKRMVTFGRAGKTAVGVHLTVKVSAAGSASRVSIEGADDDASQDAAKELLRMLRRRLS
ncbi:MAG: hypothetical protein WBW61_08220 [Rhodanobacteraceae bacterium]